MKHLRAAAILVALGAIGCSADLRGTLTIEPDEAQDSVRFTFAPAAGQVEPGHLFLEINADGIELLFGGSRAAQACIGVPANGVVVAGVPPDEDLGCVTIAAVVYRWEEPETVADRNSGAAMVAEEGPRCGGDHVIDSASWRAIEGCPVDAGPVVRDAGSFVRDAGSFVRDGGVVPRDGGEAPDAGFVDAGDPDGGDEDEDAG